MMNYKTNLAASLVAGLFTVGQAGAAVYTEDFSSFGTVGSQLAPGGGWTVNEALGGSTEPGPMTFVSSLGSTTYGKSGAIGGAMDEPPASATTIVLSHAAATNVDVLGFSVDFAIAGDIDYPERDDFAFSFLDSSGDNVFTIGFENLGDTSTKFLVSYTVGSGTEMSLLDDLGQEMYIDIDGLYSLSFQFEANGSDPTFTGSLGVGAFATSFSGTATGIGGEDIADFAAVWDIEGGGGNHLIFDNVVVIPEPASMLMLGLSGIALMRRRRR
ncbi:MAG: PEP-CTERM sorting domain-containing protein [Verrucomicrobiales bacterium]